MPRPRSHASASSDSLAMANTRDACALAGRPGQACPSDEAGKAVLLALIADSLARGHRKVAARRTLMMLYRYGEAPRDCVDAMTEVLGRCRPADIARMRRVSIEWARLCRGLPTRSRRDELLERMASGDSGPMAQACA